jgi:hypothetical protein
LTQGGERRDAHAVSLVIEEIRSLAKSLTQAQFVARFPWQFLATGEGVDALTLTYVTREMAAVDAAAAALAPREPTSELAGLFAIMKSGAPNARVLVGRARRCDIVLHDASVSKMHASLSLRNQVVVEVTDLGSHNGTRVEGEALEPQVPRAVRVGDRIDFGSVTARLVDAVMLFDLLA